MDSRTPERATTPNATASSPVTSAAAATATPEAIEFVRFCRHRRSVGWPELYDEMCAVAGRGLFRGWGADELNAHGVGFSLFDMPRLAVLVQQVIADERSGRGASEPSRRPVGKAQPPSHGPTHGDAQRPDAEDGSASIPGVALVIAGA